MEFKELRKKAGLTQGQLAEKLDLGQSTVAAWECGKAKPLLEKSAKNLHRM